MSEFTKVLEKMEQNVNAGKWAMDGIQYLLYQGDLSEPKWTDFSETLTVNFTETERYRVKPIVTGMFSADIAKELCSKTHDPCVPPFFYNDVANSLNEFVESKLPAIREQAIREFIEFVKGKNPPWHTVSINDIEVKFCTMYGKPPQLPEPIPSDFPAAPAAPVMPEQGITIQPGDYVPHELITSEAVFNLVIKAFGAALDKSTFSFLNYRGWQEGKSASNKGIGITSDKEEITNLSISAKRPLTLQQLFNATNNFEWPEGTDAIMEGLGRIEFVKSDPTSPAMPGVKTLATLVK